MFISTTLVSMWCVDASPTYLVGTSTKRHMETLKTLQRREKKWFFARNWKQRQRLFKKEKKKKCVNFIKWIETVCARQTISIARQKQTVTTLPENFAYLFYFLHFCVLCLISFENTLKNICTHIAEIERKIGQLTDEALHSLQL